METIRFSVRFPPDVHARLKLNAFQTQEFINDIVVKATEEKLDREGVPRQVKIRRRKSAQSA